MLRLPLRPSPCEFESCEYPRLRSLTLLSSPLASDVYLVISSYGVVSTTSTKGACNRAENTQETLPTPFSIHNQPDASYMDYTVASYFIDYLTRQGQFVASCDFSNVQSTDSSRSITFFKSYPSVSSTASSSLFQANESSTLSSTVSSSLFQPNASFSSTAREASSGLEIKNKIILGVLLPISLIALIILGVLGVRKSRNRRPAVAIANGEDSTISHRDTHFYTQRKPELEDEARRIHELMAQGRFYEIEGQEAAQEMSISS